MDKSDKVIGGSILGCWGVSALLSLATTGLLIYIVCHFVAKFW